MRQTRRRFQERFGTAKEREQSKIWNKIKVSILKIGNISSQLISSDETTVNRDTAFQKNMLEIILESFETDVNEKHKSFDYWESVIGEEFSHTVENIFYMSFLMKEGIIVAWVSRASFCKIFFNSYT